MTNKFEATREAGLDRLGQFVSQAGRHYQSKRNYDFGPASRDNVSTLSPYLSCRLITESEVVAAVLEEQKPNEAEAFLQEVCWRTYWKGWLEGRPQVFAGWRRLVAEDSRRWPEREDYQAAVRGETGIAPYDEWVRELVSTGYLHNHARMWFASIWIFTLKLPWSLGAAFFFRHLLDGDAASNTLSWRWVAGLQTKGKHYLATASNIQKFTDGRFHPEGQLVEKAQPLSGPANPPHLSPVNYPFQTSSQLGEDYAILVTGDDLLTEEGALGELKPKLLILVDPDELDSAFDFDEKVVTFKKAALADAARRGEKHFECPSVTLSLGSDPAGSLGELMTEHQLTSLAYYEPFVGLWKEVTDRMTSRDVGVRFFPLRRPWDGLLHPHAVKGYFNFKKRVLPQVIRAKGLLGTQKR
jgi:deoxyribodipyrimidine photo-lyase